MTTGVGIAIGIGVGLALGIATHNLGVGIALGVALSVAFGVIRANDHAPKAPRGHVRDGWEGFGAALGGKLP